MFGKFLILGFVPVLSGVLISLIVGAYYYDLFIGISEDSRKAPSKTPNKLARMVDLSNQLRLANEQACGALVAYSGTKDQKQKEVLDKSFAELSALTKKLGTEMGVEQKLLDSSKDVTNALSELENAIDQKKSVEHFSSKATQSGIEMARSALALSKMEDGYGMKLILDVLITSLEPLILGIVSFLLVAVLTISGFTISCRKRLKIVEENLQRMTEGKELHPPIKGGSDAITKIDHLVHQAAVKLSQKNA